MTILQHNRYIKLILTTISKRKTYNVSTRSLMRATPHIKVSMIRLALTRPSYNNCTCNAVRIKKKSQAAQDLAADGNATHLHKVQTICTIPDCLGQKCPGIVPCDTVKSVRTLGFFTHKPIVDATTRAVSDVYAKGNKDTQYYVRAIDKGKSVSGTTATHYEQTGQIKPDANMQSFMDKPEIKSKFPH